MTNPKLTIELVPRTAWWSNVRSNVSARDWEICKNVAKAQSGSRCEICGGRGRRWPVECHERWFYEPFTQGMSGRQTLIGLIALCPDCHRVKHIGRSLEIGKGPEAIMHLSKVNGWDGPTCEGYIQNAFRLWEERSMYHWVLDISYLSLIGIKVPEKLDRDKEYER